MLFLIACSEQKNDLPAVHETIISPIDLATKNVALTPPNSNSLFEPTVTYPATISLSPSPYATPTIFPATTPAGTASNFQLKEWSEPLALKLVEEAENYVQYFLHADMDWHLQRSGFMQAHEIIEVVAKETILQFPNTQSRERLEWLIVLSESLLSATWYGREPPPNTRFLALLEAGLHDGRYDLNDLDANLNPFGFEVRRYNPYGESIPQYVENLFGDNQIIPMAVISRVAGDPLLAANVSGFADDDGFLVVFRKNEHGKYIPLLIESVWAFSSSGYESIKVDDFTADGLPEIEVSLYTHSGSMYDRYISVWKWQNNSFVDLVGGIHMPGSSQWHFGINELDGSPELQTNEYINGVGGPITTTYAWNGSSFEPASIEFANWPEDVPVPTLPASIPIQQISTPTPEKIVTENDLIQMELLLFEQANTELTISMLESLLIDPNIKIIGRYTRPRLYYLLALAYEINNNKEYAVKNYWYIWQHHSDSPYTILAQAKLEKKP